MRSAAPFDIGGGGSGVLVPPKPETRPRVGKKRERRPPPPAPPDDPGDGGRGWWGGDHPPPPDGTPSGAGRIALMLAMAGISTLFAVFLAVWIFLRRESPGAGPDASFAPPATLWLSTVILLASSGTISRASGLVPAGSARRKSLRGWLTASLALGVGFLLSQAFLWSELVQRGIVPSSDGYMATFYALTILHGMHVLGGLVYMTSSVVGLFRRAGFRGGESIRLCALYWHFMGVIWIVVFAVLTFLR